MILLVGVSVIFTIAGVFFTGPLCTLFGAEMVWITFAVYEAIVLIIAVILLKYSERNGIVFK